MANELQQLSEEQQKWLAEQGIHEDTWRALQSSLFPGANPASVQMYWHYCQARKLDPMKKPAHIVPMQVKDARTGNYEWRDVVMPGIAEARITANRTGEYCGQDEPEFGPEIDQDIGGLKITAPSYCTVRVYRAMGGRIATFAHTEYFEEACATTKNGQPNAMWKKRKRGQLAKCAEAGALRKAFPEELGGEITSDEAHENATPIDVGPQRQSGATDALGRLRPAADTQGPTETEAEADASEGGSETDVRPAAEESLSRENAESADNSVPLYGLGDEVHGTYQRQGSWLNALVKLLLQYEGQPESVTPIVEANRPVIERIRTGGGQADKLADLDTLIQRLTAIEAESGQSSDDWVSGYDNASGDQASTDDALLGQVQDGLEEAVAAGEVEKIRARITIAQQISDEGIRQDALDELDNALTRAQGSNE